MSLARFFGSAALVATLVTVATGEANALTRKAAYKPTESWRMSERAYVINWKASARAFKLWLPTNFAFARAGLLR